MVKRVEFLMSGPLGRYGTPILTALCEAAQVDGAASVRITKDYEGRSDTLVLWGVGAPNKNRARQLQRQRGGKTLCWDLAYIGRQPVDAYTRVSVDHEHPQHLLDDTPDDPSRFEAHGIELREAYNPNGHIVLAALGRKSRAYLGPEYDHWERNKLAELRERFKGARIIYRPKPTRSRAPGWMVHLDCETDTDSPFASLLEGAALVVSRHSNVSVDAAIAGVPSESEDGAARWMVGKPYNRDTRLSFLRRICWWQWRTSEAAEAWEFLKPYLGLARERRVA